MTPKAVVFDASKDHHITITVNHKSEDVHYCCSCGVDAFFPMCDLNMVREIIKDTPNAQVLVWLEMPDV